MAHARTMLVRLMLAMMVLPGGAWR